VYLALSLQRRIHNLINRRDVVQGTVRQLQGALHSSSDLDLTATALLAKLNSDLFILR
jgi:hypothetical protein